ncbi:MAG TPA: hypothetical protein VGI87_09265, partial [Solirubrobacteraceae bacterium]
MSVISDKDTTSEPLEGKAVSSSQTHEQRPALVVPGLLMTIVGWVLVGVGISLIFEGKVGAVIGVVLIVIFGAALGGVFVVQPNEGRVLTLLGRYNGSVTEAGLWWCNPFNKRKKI